MSHIAPTKEGIPVMTLVLMSSVTFMAILSELVPSGVLPQIGHSLEVDNEAVGALVGIYALASAICAIPLISLTESVNRKKLLLTLLAGFSLSNFIIALSTSYYIIMICRVLGGMCAGVLWAMIGAYGMRIVPKDRQGLAVTIVMTGTTLGICIGMPIMTKIGTAIIWNAEFMVMAALIFIIMILTYLFIPSVEGEKSSKETSALALIKRKTILIVLLLTLLAVIAHYGAYIYIALLVREIELKGGIELALLMFGAGSLLSAFFSGKYSDSHLQQLIVGLLSAGAIAMTLFILFGGLPLISHAAFFIWGISFGSLVAIFQAAVTRQVKASKDIAISIQSSGFNFGIMLASSIGGYTLTLGNIMTVVQLALALLVIAAVITYFSNKTMSKVVMV